MEDVVIVALTLVGMLINFIGVSPIRALFWTAVLNGLLAPPLLVLIMLVSDNKKVMGERVNSRWINTLGWLTAAVMIAAAIGLLAAWGSPNFAKSHVLPGAVFRRRIYCHAVPKD